MTLVSILSIGFVLGLRHALDADHIVAVTTLVTRKRSWASAAWVGALWGLGHCLTLCAAGGALMAFRVVFPPRVGLGLELLVAIMLMVLGGSNLRRTAPSPATAEDESNHHRMPEKPMAPLEPPLGSLAQPPKGETHRHYGPRALAVGMVHGLAGSAALALMVLTTVRDTPSALAYLGIFGLGTMVGMLLLSVAVALPVAWISRRFISLDETLGKVAGLASVLLGAYLVYRIGFVDGLFGPSPHWTPE